MKKILFSVISILIAITLINPLASITNDVSVEDIEIEYTLTSTTDVLSHDLSNEDFDYIIDNYLYITDHTSLLLSDGVTYTDFVEVNDETTYLDVAFGSTYYKINYEGYTIIKGLGGDSLVEGPQTVTIYFTDVPITNTTTTFISFIPLIFVASIIVFIYTRKED